MEIKDGKIWIERDGTEIGVANELVEAGVPKQDIVLAFKAPYKRKFTLVCCWLNDNINFINSHVFG